MGFRKVVAKKSKSTPLICLSFWAFVGEAFSLVLKSFVLCSSSSKSKLGFRSLVIQSESESKRSCGNGVSGVHGQDAGPPELPESLAHRSHAHHSSRHSLYSLFLYIYIYSVCVWNLLLLIV